MLVLDPTFKGEGRGETGKRRGVDRKVERQGIGKGRGGEGEGIASFLFNFWLRTCTRCVLSFLFTRLLHFI